VKTKPEKVRLVVDTNVACDFYSFHDLIGTADRLQSVGEILLSPDAAYRTARSRDTIMFAWFCHRNQAKASGLVSEVLETLLTRVPPDAETEPTTQFLKSILYFVADYLVPRWTIKKYDDEPEGLVGNAADDWLLSKAASEGIALITNEGYSKKGLSDFERKGKLNLRGKARKRGVAVYTPGEYLRLRKFDYAANGKAFAKAFESKRPRYLHGRDDSEAADKALKYLFGLYRFVLFGEVEDQYRHLPRLSLPTPEG